MGGQKCSRRAHIFLENMHPKVAFCAPIPAVLSFVTLCGSTFRLRGFQVEKRENGGFSARYQCRLCKSVVEAQQKSEIREIWILEMSQKKRLVLGRFLPDRIANHREELFYCLQTSLFTPCGSFLRAPPAPSPHPVEAFRATIFAPETLPQGVKRESADGIL
jgi:hypothetical protein